MSSRRQFLRLSLLGCSALLLPTSLNAVYARPLRILSPRFQTIAAVYDDLFPASADTPGAIQLNTLGYLQAVLNDQRVAKEKQAFIINGSRWVDETSKERFSRSYLQLNASQRQAVLEDITQYQWGDVWVYYLMEYLFESMFCDPVYGANPDKKGWAWLELEPGLPRPEGPLI
jgi:hypothetical protein